MGAIISNGIIFSGGGGSSTSIVEITQAEYNALSEEERKNGTIYYITDATEDVLASSALSYDNKLSGLSATDVQGAIDELAGAATVDITEEEYLANKDVYDASDNIYFTSDDSKEDYVIFASEVYMDDSKTQTVKSKIETAIGNLSFSVNGNNLVITDGNKTWTLTSS